MGSCGSRNFHCRDRQRAVTRGVSTERWVADTQSGRFPSKGACRIFLLANAPIFFHGVYVFACHRVTPFLVATRLSIQHNRCKTAITSSAVKHGVPRSPNRDLGQLGIFRKLDCILNIRSRIFPGIPGRGTTRQLRTHSGKASRRRIQLEDNTELQRTLPTSMALNPSKTPASRPQTSPTGHDATSARPSAP